MNKHTKTALVVLRVVMGWFFLYAGLTKVLNPSWSAAGALGNAKLWPSLYAWFASPANIGWVNFVNEWGLTLLGVSLILGIGVRFSSLLGAGLMLLYYGATAASVARPTPYTYLIDDHLIYVAILLFFAASRAGRVYGLEDWCEKLPICRRIPWFHKWWG